MKKCRVAFIHVMNKLLHATKHGPEADVKTWWKKLLLLPIVLFSRLTKKKLSEHADLVCKNEWPFKIGDFPLRFFRYDFQDHPRTLTSKTWVMNLLSPTNTEKRMNTLS